MLQQTTIATVKPYFAAFLQRFPSVEDMASAPLDDVLAAWAGLGYYARARNLHKCAGVVSGLGSFPSQYEALLQLPGIGPYTAAAIAAIAFEQAHVPVDGNVERVLSRLLRIDDTLPAAKPVFRDAAIAFESTYRPGDFAQALMDLGSTICTPRAPRCDLCPWSDTCASRGKADIESFPRKAVKKAKPVRYGVAFVHINDDGVLVSRRAETGLLGGMLGLPGTDWREAPWRDDEALGFAPFAKVPWVSAGSVRHIFTHFDLRVSVYVATTTDKDNGHRIPIDALDAVALPSLFMKVIKSAL